MSMILGVQAIINTLGYLAVIWAFRTSFREINSASWWFAIGFANLAGAIILRALYWDIALPLCRFYFPEWSAVWVNFVDGRSINILFNGQKTFSFYCALKCRQMMIEECERYNWPWYKAWLYPTRIRFRL